MGHDVVDNNKVVSHIRQRTKETFDTAYNKVAKTFDESERYHKALGNVKELGNKITKNFRKLRKAIKDSSHGPVSNGDEDHDGENEGSNNNYHAVNGQPPPPSDFGSDNNKNNNVNNKRRKKVIASTFRQRYDNGYNDVLKLLEKERKLRRKTEYEMMNLKKRHDENKLSNQIIDGVPQRHALLKPTTLKKKTNSKNKGTEIAHRVTKKEETPDEESEEEDEVEDEDDVYEEEDDPKFEETEEALKIESKGKESYKDLEDRVEEGEELVDPEEMEEQEENKLLGIKEGGKMEDEPVDEDNFDKKSLMIC